MPNPDKTRSVIIKILFIPILSIKNNVFTIITKKAEPFDAYQNFGYRQVDLLRNKHKQPTP